MRLEDWPVRLQVAIGPVIVLGVLLLTVVLNVGLANRLDRSRDALSQAVETNGQLNRYYRGVLDMETGVRGFALARDPAFLEPYLRGRSAAATSLAALQAQAEDDQRRVVLGALAGVTGTWVAYAELAILDAADGTIETSLTRGKDQFDAIRRATDQLLAEEDVALQERVTAEASLRQLVNVLRPLALLIGFAALGLAILIGDRVIQPIVKFASFARRIGRGQLDERVPVRGSNEVNQTAAALNSMAGSLQLSQTALVEQREAAEQRAREADVASSTSRAILDASNEAIVLIGEDRELKAINARFREFFGDDPALQPGARLREMVDHLFGLFVDAEAAFAELNDAARVRDGVFTRILLQRAPQPRDIEAYSAPVFDSTGDPAGRLFAFRDVTREREVDRLKTEFVSMVSHELRTPLTSIKGYVDLMLDEELGELPAAQRTEFLTIVKNNSDRLVSLINDLLDVSRIDSGRVTLNLGPVDLAQVIDDIAMSVRPQLMARAQGLTMVVEPDLPLVLADASRVMQILTNLVSNAYKYTPNGGQVTIEAAAVGDMVRVTVRDTGIGMSPAELAKLFSRFYRANNPAAAGVGGTGLGLAITRSLIELHHGRIEVTSEPGVGSALSFTLPLDREARSEVGRPRPAVTTEGLRVLVVDDEPDIAKLLQRYLERAGYSVETASTAAEAMRLIRSSRPSLVCLDVMLPDGDGFGVLRELQADPRLAGVPVMLLSVLPDDGQGRRLGAVGYLSKPVRESIFVQQVTTLLEGERTTVLIVDDDPDVRSLLVAMIGRSGHDALVAGSGEEGLRLARERLPGLILLDVRMPGMDGLATLQALRADPAIGGTRVVIMSASPGAIEDVRAASEALGATVAATKPLSAEAVVELIGSRLDRQP